MAQFDVRVDCKQPRCQAARLFRMVKGVKMSWAFVRNSGGCMSAVVRQFFLIAVFIAF
jgi:hypothetical protein